MENAAEALKMASAVLIFVLMLSVTITMFSLARRTSDIVLSRVDETTYYDYYSEDDLSTGTERIVGLETIIPTIHKYNKENYRITFLKEDDSPLYIYTSPMHGQISVLDLDDENVERHEPWTGSNDEVKKFIDALVMGGTYTYTGGELKISGTNALIRKFNGKKFKEYVGKGAKTEDSEESSVKKKTTTKTYITYKLIS